MVKPVLRITHNQDGDDQLVPVDDSLDVVKANDAIQALEAKMASYPLPTAAVSKMTPPIPGQPIKKSPASQQPSAKSAPTAAKAQAAAKPVAAQPQPSSATTVKPKVEKPKTKVVAQSPTELQIIHEDK